MKNIFIDSLIYILFAHTSFWGMNSVMWKVIRKQVNDQALYKDRDILINING